MKNTGSNIANEITTAPQKEALLSEIRSVLNAAKHNIVREVNSQIVHAYWQIGKYIVEYEQGGAQRAEYDKNLINDLAQQLQSEFGTGFNATNLRYMRQFYQVFPIYHTACDKLNWSHIRLIITCFIIYWRGAMY